MKVINITLNSIFGSLAVLNLTGIAFAVGSIIIKLV